MASKINVDKIARGSGTPEFTIPTADGAANTFLKTNGSGVLSFAANLTYDGNTLDIKNAGTASSIKVYCETSNLHYTEIKSGPHSGATSYTLTLPNTPPSVSGQVLSATTAGVASWATAADVSGLASVQTFTSSGTWTKPTGVTKVIMEVQGAGGGGSYRQTAHVAYLSGAGGGGYAKKFLDVSSISTSTITVGSGGATVNGGSSAQEGNDGGNSSWADGTNTITGNGGANGGYDATTRWGVIGGTASGGDINIPGGVGTARNSIGTVSGGDSVLGHGGVIVCETDTGSATYSNSHAAKDGTGYGGGGSAGWEGNSGVSSGAGADGIVIVWEYK